MIFVCWLFQGFGFDRSKVCKYSPNDVRILKSMLARHGGHDLVCVTDMGWMMQDVNTITMPPAVSELPKYYPKLWAFSEEFGRRIGRRFTSIDLDVILLRDVAGQIPDADFAIWNQARGEPYNSSLFSLEPGSRRIVWDRFSPREAELARVSAKHRWTGDQSWIAHILGGGETTFGEETGVLQYRPTLHRNSPPVDARALFTCGPYTPASEAENSPWIKEHYR